MIATSAARIAVDLLWHTWNVSVGGQGEQEQIRAGGQPVIFAVWHGQLLPAMCQHRRQGITLLVSSHGDGEYLARAATQWGYHTVRGSSTHGSLTGLRGLVRTLRAGGDVAVTPDGPRGPARTAKVGAIALAQMTGAPIIPMGTAATPAWRAGSWDGFMLPRPLARVSVAYGPAIRVGRGADAAAFAAHELRTALDQAGEAAQCRL